MTDHHVFDDRLHPEAFKNLYTEMIDACKANFRTCTVSHSFLHAKAIKHASWVIERL